MLKPIVAAITAIKRKVEQHGNHLSQNEYRTRAVLIDPLLQALEWNTADPNQVQMEYPINEGLADYALLDRSKALMVIEAKKLNERLLRPHFDQARSYAVQSKAPYFAITDGNLWRAYHVSQTDWTTAYPLLHTNIFEGNRDDIAKKLLLISQPILTAHNIARLAGQKLPGSQEPDQTNPPDPGWITLAEFEPGQSRPRNIQLPDGTVKPVKYWKDLLIHAAEYLVARQMLTAQAAPIAAAAGSKRNLVSRTPKHRQPTSAALSYRLSRNLYLEVELRVAWCLPNAKHLLEHFDISLTEVRVQIA